MIKTIFIKIIKIYQKTLSPDHGPLSSRFPSGFCRFHPSCSQYAVEVIEKYGSLKGLLLGFYRINRCNPWSKGGVDGSDNISFNRYLAAFLVLILYIVTVFILVLIFMK